MIDTKQVLRRMFLDLTRDSVAAQQLGVTSSEGYAILGAELNESGEVISACVDVPTLIEKIVETLETAGDDYRRLVTATLDSRPTRPIAGREHGRVRKLIGSVEVMPDPVDFAVSLDDAYSPTLPLPRLRMRGTPGALLVESPYGGTREYRGRCASVVVDDLATVCLLPADHQGDCDRIPLLTSTGLVCGDLLVDTEFATFCRVPHPHRPARHHGERPTGGVLLW